MSGRAIKPETYAAQLAHLRAETAVKHAAIRESVPAEAREAYDALVADYQFCATLRTGRAFVSRQVLADLVRSGWRRSAPGELPAGAPR